MLRPTNRLRNAALVSYAKLSLIALICALLIIANPSQAANNVSQLGQNSIHSQETPIPDKLIKQVGFGPKGEWLILYGVNGYASLDLAEPVVTKLSKLNDDKEEIQWVAFGPDGAWLISSAKDFYFDKLPTDLQTEMDRLIKDGKGTDIKYVAFAPDGGWILIWGTNGYTANNLPKTAVDEITKLNADSKEIKQLTFDSKGEWVIVYGTNGLVWSDKADEGLVEQLKKLNEAGEDIRQISFSPDDGTSGIGWIVLYGKDQVVGKNLPKTFVDKMKELDLTLQ